MIWRTRLLVRRRRAWNMNGIIMNKILLASASLDVEFRDADDFARWELPLYRPPPISAAYTREAYESDKASGEERLRLALSTYWQEIEDYEVAFDENEALTLCGGIYSSRIVCREYLQIVYDVLQQMSIPGWSYSTAMEITDEVDLADVAYGEFIIVGNCIVVEAGEDSLPRGFDFVKLFSRSKAAAETEGAIWLR